MNLASQIQRGFTLVEVMVVIVIMTIVTSLVVLNLDSIHQRRAMQARDSFLLDLQRIGRDSVDQSRILALVTRNATDVAPFQYGVLAYVAPRAGRNNNTMMDVNQLWQPYAEFQWRELPSQVYFNINPTQDDAVPANRNNAVNPLTDEQAPKLIWLGNGEVKSVRIQFYNADHPIGAAINIDHLGKISDAE